MFKRPVFATRSAGRARAWLAAGLLAAGGLVAPISRADFTVDWATLDGGGALFTSGAGGFLLSGTIAQFDTGVLSGGGGPTFFRLTGGFWAAPAAAPSCSGDADGDGDVDQDDIDIVLFNYPGSVPPGTNGDLDGDGDVDQDDIDIVLFNYGASCP